jgi:hypothetical protein
MGDQSRPSDIANRLLKYLIQFVIPVVIALFFWYILATTFKFWRLSGMFIALTFYSILVIVSLAISFGIRWFTGPKDSKRVLIFILSSMVLPLIVGLAANTIPVSDNETVLTLALRRIMGREEYWFVRNIGDTVIHSVSVETKLAGIGALKAINTEMALSELFRILEEDPDILLTYSTYGSLSDAIASYDSLARDRLVKQFYESTQTTKGTPRGLNFDLYERYFRNSFESLDQLLAQESLDDQEAQARSLSLDSAAVQLRETLTQLQMGRRRYLDPSLNFVLDTFIEMNLREDNEIYSLAKTIASDSTYAEATRSAAIRLFASLGSRADFELLTSYLDSDSESVKASALEGIEILHRKITGSDNQ